ncbi:MAG: RNA ligase family protein [Clostridia bacterium]|nr:RNA ligase family protein [Clostridia bacterium]
MDYSIIKYPRTPHLEGSRLGVGDEDLHQIPFTHIFGRNIVIEEKIDGANTAISFDGDGNLLLQSRGHYLTGGHREKHYNLLKQWATLHQDVFFDVLSDRFVMYGEWLYAKHTVYYDALPHYFMEFDIYDREKKEFLDTDRRRELVSKMNIVHSVPVLSRGIFTQKEAILSLIGPSNYITEKHIDNLIHTAQKLSLDVEVQLRETDNSMHMEGLYIKVEEDGVVKERMKFVRASFLQCILASDSHWLARPILPNKLKDEN